MIVHQWEGKMFCQFRGPAHSHGGKITEVMSSYNEGFGCYNIKTAHTWCLQIQMNAKFLHRCYLQLTLIKHLISLICIIVQSVARGGISIFKALSFEII